MTLHGTSPERKNVDLTGAFPVPALSQWTNCQLLNGIDAGALATQRIGRRCTFTSLQFRGVLLQSAGGAQYSQVRVIVVYDRNNLNLTPSSFPTIMQFNDSMSPLNLQNSDRFVVLADVLSDHVQSTSLPVTFSFYKKIKCETIYTGTGTVAANINSGAIWAFVAGNQGTGSAAAGSVEMTFRLRFTDV